MLVMAILTQIEFAKLKISFLPIKSLQLIQDFSKFHLDKLVPFHITAFSSSLLQYYIEGQY
jgi:hypothetical protein